MQALVSGQKAVDDSEMIYYRPVLSLPQDAAPDCAGFAATALRITAVEKIERGHPSKLIPYDDVPRSIRQNWATPRHISGEMVTDMQVMAVLNVTPDSFSDGGVHHQGPALRARVAQIAQSGARLIDIGGESTRPGSVTVPADEEITRVQEAITLAAQHRDLVISLDTRKAAVAQRGLDLGVHVINDVSGFIYDAALAPLVAQRGVPVCIMHAQGDPQTMQDNPRYENVLLDVYDFLEQRIAALVEMGVARGDIIIDPGIGFGKTQEHNLALLHRLSLFHSLGVSVLLGVSRKRFIGTIGGAQVAADRMPGSVAVGLFAAAQGVQVLRVHDVDETMQALRLWQAMHASEMT